VPRVGVGDDSHTLDTVGLEGVDERVVMLRFELSGCGRQNRVP
jgi:hypothetical protein